LLRCVSISLLAAIAIPNCAVAQVATSLKEPPPQVTTVLPENTAGVLLINTNGAAWKELERFNPLPKDLFSSLGLPLLPGGRILEEANREVQSWLGDRIAIALLPAVSKEDTFESNTVFLVPIKDTSRFNTFFSKLKAGRGQPQIERDYKGVTILQWTLPGRSVESPAAPSIPGKPDQVPDQTRSPHSQPSPAALFNPLLPLTTGSPLQTKAVKPGDNFSKPGLENPIPPFPDTPKPGTQGKPRTVAIALLSENLAISTQPEALEKLIDARSTGTSLAQNPLFQRTLRHPQFGRSLLVGYGEVASFTRYIANFYSSIGNNGASNLPSIFLPPLNEGLLSKMYGAYNTIDTHLWVQPEGIHGQTNLYYTTPQPNLATPVRPDANHILTRLPAATYVSTNGRNLKQQWQVLEQAGRLDPVSKEVVDGIRKTLPTLTGLDLEKDLVPWMDGEYTAFLFPTTGGLFNYFYPDFNLGVGLIIQTSDRPAAEAALKKMDRFIQKTSNGEVAAVSRRIKGQPVISWEGRDKNRILSVLAHGWVDRDTLIITTGSGPMAALNPKPYLPLHLNYTFKTATDSLPTPNQGYFYVNMGSSLAFLYGLILPSVPRTYDPFVQQVQRVLGTLRSVSTTTSGTSEAQTVDSLWVLGADNRTKE
jgi:hypothetical protein